MSKFRELEKLCLKIGIFRATGVGESTQTTRRPVTFGPYGHLILNQIKNEWLKANLFKYENSFLLENVNLFSCFNSVAQQQQQQQAEASFDLTYFIDSLKSVYSANKLPVCLANVYSAKPGKRDHHPHQSPLEYTYDDPAFACSDSHLFYLNAFHFCGGTGRDYFLSVQRERKNWWSKLLDFPENVQQQTSQALSYGAETSLVYELIDEDHFDVGNHQAAAKTPPEITWLESVKMVDRSDSTLKHLFEQHINKSSSSACPFQEAKHLVITQTTCHDVLKAILHDSFQHRVKRSSDAMGSKKIVFRLDFRMAPFKACILFQPTKISSKVNDQGAATVSSKQQVVVGDPKEGEGGDAASTKKGANNNKKKKDSGNLSANDSKLVAKDNLSSIAIDLRKMLYMNQTRCMVTEIKGESELDAHYDQLDEMGVPYAIYLPNTIAKDGICLVRNRDTTLSEQMHISQLAKQFTAIANALSY